MPTLNRATRGTSRIGAILAVLFLVAMLLPGAVLAAPATKLVITSVVPASNPSGQAIAVTVQAQDGTNAIDVGFVGSVTFTSSDGAATVSPASGYTYTTGDAGTKTFTVTLRSFGSRTFAFQSAGITDTATKTVDVTASRLVFTVTPSGGASGLAWATQPEVEIRDETGARVTTSTATISLAIGTNPAAGAITGCASLTAVAGFVDVSGCKIDKAGDGYTLVASSGLLISGTSGPFNITPGPASKLAFSTQPARGTPGGALAAQPVVEIQDAAGNRVLSDSTTSVTLALSAGSGTLTCSGGLTRQAASGRAAYTGCAVNNAGIGFAITATASGLSSAISSAFDVADRLVFTTQPSASVTAGVAFFLQPVVAVRAGASSTATNDSATVVSLSLQAGTGASGATLTCDSGLSRTVSAGVATFAGCKIDKVSPVSPSNPYVIIASASGLSSASSTTVAVNPGAAAKLTFTSQPNSATSNQPFPIQPVVAIQDLGGNTVTSNTATVTLAIGTNPAGGTLTCTGGLTRVAVAGVATFSGCLINNAGVGYTLTATATGLTGATTPAFTVGSPVASISLTTSAATITWQGGIVLTTQFGTNGAGKTFQLQATRDNVTWFTIATPTTDSAGRNLFAYRPPTNLFYRAVFTGTPDLQAGMSPSVRTVVRQIAILRPTNLGAVRSISRNTSITFFTVVRPSRPELTPARVTFSFFRRSGSTWVLSTQRTVTAAADGRAATTFRFSTSGQWYVRSMANPTPFNANSVMSSIERYSVN